MKANLRNLVGKSFAIGCQTIEHSKRVLLLLHNAGYELELSGVERPLPNNNVWYINGHNTCWTICVSRKEILLKNRNQCYMEKKLIIDSEDFIKDNSDKNESMKNYEVDENFIREAHKAACKTWQRKLEQKFPEVFNKINVVLGSTVRHHTGDIYMVAEFEPKKFGLLNLTSGRTYDESKGIEWDGKTPINLTEILGQSYTQFFEEIS